MGAPSWPMVFFDLDGTLTDSAPGIMRCIEHAYAGLERSAPPQEQLRDWIGPPLQQSFERAFHGDRELARKALRLYRERFSRVGWRENRLIDGIGPLLHGLRAAGFRSWVVTSKPTVYARRIVSHFGLAEQFEDIRGSELDGRGAGKSELIGSLLRQCRLPRQKTAMVGDRRHDIDGAKENGIAALGVTWGYGSRQELEAAGADALVCDVAALQELLLSSSPNIA